MSSESTVHSPPKTRWALKEWMWFQSQHWKISIKQIRVKTPTNPSNFWIFAFMIHEVIRFIKCPSQTCLPPPQQKNQPGLACETQRGRPRALTRWFRPGAQRDLRVGRYRESGGRGPRESGVAEDAGIMCLEDYPKGCVWLITMVTKSPKWGCFPLQKWPFHGL